MTVRQRILDVLELNRGEYLSGRYLVDELGVTRSAISKAVGELVDTGYPIHTSRRGYMLDERVALLTLDGIDRHLYSDIPYTLLDEVVSTNDIAKRAGVFGEDEQVFIASSQSGGRGRRGRKFFCKKGTGIYMSLLLRPSIKADQTLRLTTMSAVAVADAIRDVVGIEAGIKWVNDVYIDGLKVAGILTEASYGMESNSVDFVVVGVGINVVEPTEDYPEELRGIAGAICDYPSLDVANALASRVIDNILEGYRDILKGDYSYVERYQRMSILTGREVHVDNGDIARVIGIDDKCALVIEYPSGEKRALNSGEVSVRLR